MSVEDKIKFIIGDLILAKIVLEAEVERLKTPSAPSSPDVPPVA
jgi:hypothetical protein